MVLLQSMYACHSRRDCIFAQALTGLRLSISQLLAF